MTKNIKNTKQTNSFDNSNIIEIDFKALGIETDDPIDSKYEVLKLKAREAAPLLAKYTSKPSDIEAFVASLSFENYLEILKNTSRDGVFINENNFDSFFENNVKEVYVVIVGSLLTHMKYSQKKSSGIKVNSTLAKISD